MKEAELNDTKFENAFENSNNRILKRQIYSNENKNLLRRKVHRFNSIDKSAVSNYSKNRKQIHRNLLLKRENKSQKHSFKSHSRNLLSKSGKKSKNHSIGLKKRLLKDQYRRNQFHNSLRSSQNHFRRHKRILEELFNQEEMLASETDISALESLEPTLVNRILEESTLPFLPIGQNYTEYFTKFYANIQFYQNSTSSEILKKNVDPNDLIYFKKQLTVNSGIDPYWYTKNINFDLAIPDLARMIRGQSNDDPLDNNMNYIIMAVNGTFSNQLSKSMSTEYAILLTAEVLSNDDNELANLDYEVESNESFTHIDFGFFESNLQLNNHIPDPFLTRKQQMRRLKMKNELTKKLAGLNPKSLEYKMNKSLVKEIKAKQARLRLFNGNQVY